VRSITARTREPVSAVLLVAVLLVAVLLGAVLVVTGRMIR